MPAWPPAAARVGNRGEALRHLATASMGILGSVHADPGFEGPRRSHWHGQVGAHRAQDRRNPGLDRDPASTYTRAKPGMATWHDHRCGLVLALSYSGESDEILTLLRCSSDRGTRSSHDGRPQSTAGARIRPASGRQRTQQRLPAWTWRPTPSTTANLAMGDALAVALLERGAYGRRLCPLAPGRQPGAPTVCISPTSCTQAKRCRALAGTPP